MKKKVIVIVSALTLFSTMVFSQKVQKEFYSISKKVSFEYQTNNEGVKNGYFKSFSKTGLLVESGSYKLGKKNGVWTTYDEKGTGQIISTLTYVDDKLNGVCKQWLFKNAKRYLWQDYICANDENISGVTYYPNGKKEKELKNGFTLTWTEDGTANEELINGKLYEYYVNGDGNRILDNITFDTLGLTMVYHYSSSYTTDLRSISSYNGKSSNRKIVDTWDFNTKTKPIIHINGDPNGTPIALDSTNVRKAMILFMADANPKKSKEVIYDSAKGDIIVFSGKVNSTHFHYLETPKNAVFITKYEGIVKKEDFYLKYEYENGRENTIEFGIQHYYTNGKLSSEIEVIPVHNDYPKKITRLYDENGNLKKQ